MESEDAIIGKQPKQMQYKYAIYEKTRKGENAKELARIVIHLLSSFKEYVKSIITDNGTESACHEMIAKSLGVTINFSIWVGLHDIKRSPSPY